MGGCILYLHVQCHVFMTLDEKNFLCSEWILLTSVRLSLYSYKNVISSNDYLTIILIAI